jgi:hypothetical protein
MNENQGSQQEGIGLYKIRYEMDVKDSVREQNYIAGVIAYSSDEAIQTLTSFAQKNVKGFKGMKIDEVSFDGNCHALSDRVRGAIIDRAMAEGVVVSKEQYRVALEASAKPAVKKTKKSIVPKD